MPQTFTSFDGIKIAYLDEGAGPAVVLLHGYGLDGMGQYGPFEYSVPLLRRSFELFREAFGTAPDLPDPPAQGRVGLIARLIQNGFRAIVPDMRGFGQSGKPDHVASYANSAMARDVIALVDHLNLPDAGLVGFSMGAITAARVLTLDRDRFRVAVLSGIGDYILEGELLKLPPTFPVPPDIPQPLTHETWAEEGARILEKGEFVSGHLGSAHLIAAKAMNANPKMLAAIIRGAVSEMIPRRAFLDSKASVLLLNGSQDIANQQISHLLTEFPNATAAWCDGDHYSAAFQPTFQDSVITFVRNSNLCGANSETQTHLAE